MEPVVATVVPELIMLVVVEELGLYAQWLNQGDVLHILVGQKAAYSKWAGSGGGNSFVAKNNVLLIVAGGGGGGGLIYAQPQSINGNCNKQWKKRTS